MRSRSARRSGSRRSSYMNSRRSSKSSRSKKKLEIWAWGFFLVP
jgi:hypothetical protein